MSTARETSNRYVRVAELEIDSARVEEFAAAAREVGQASVRVEDGCLVLYAVAERSDPGCVRVFEIYRDRNAYDLHLQTAHFEKFRGATDAMVRSRRLIDARALSLAAKPTEALDPPGPL